MADNSNFSHSHFDGPIPGESLTATPGNSPWQHPPRHTDLHEALTEVWERLMQPKQLAKLITLLEAGVPAQAVADTILFTGFVHGHWTPDLAILMAKSVWAMVAAIGHRAGLDFKLKTKTEDHLDEFLRNMGNITKNAPPKPKGDVPPAPEEPPETPAPKGGLMGSM